MEPFIERKRSAMLISKFLHYLRPGKNSKEDDEDESSEFSKKRFSRCYFNVASCFTSRDY